MRPRACCTSNLILSGRLLGDLDLLVDPTEEVGELWLDPQLYKVLFHDWSESRIASKN